MENHKGKRSAVYTGYDKDGIRRTWFFHFDKKRGRDVKFFMTGVREQSIQQYRSKVYHYSIRNAETNESRELTYDKMKKYCKIEEPTVDLNPPKTNRRKR